MRLFTCALTLVASIATWAPALAGPPQATQLQYLIGTWSCTTTGGMGTFSESERVTAVPGWVHGDGTISVNGQPAGHEDFYIGYDAHNARWVLISIDSENHYSIATSSSPSLASSQWVATFPHVSGSGTFTAVSATQYAVDETGTSNGQTQTMREVCTKQ